MNKKIFKRLLFILLLSVLLVAVAAADDKNVFTTYDNALGGFVGEIGGSGLSYQHWFGDFGIQTAAGLYYYPQDDGDNAISYSIEPVVEDNFTYNVGLEVQYMLYEDSYGNWLDGALYLFGGGTHTGAVRTTYYYEKVVTGEVTEYPKTGQSNLQYVPGLSLGFGFGFELVFFNHFSIPFEIGIGGAWEYGSWVPVDAGIKPQAGFRYRF